MRAHKGNFRRGPRLGKAYEQVELGPVRRVRRADRRHRLGRRPLPGVSAELEGAGWPRACGAEAHRALSGRNWLQPLTSLIGRWRPDLLGAWEGGSNTTLVRPGAGRDRRAPARRRSPGRPELRVMALTRLESGLCVANLHVSTKPSSAERELLDAAERGDGVRRLRPADLRRRLQRQAQGERGLRPARGALRPRAADRARPAQPPARARPGGDRAPRRLAAGGPGRGRPRDRAARSGSPTTTP